MRRTIPTAFIATTAFAITTIAIIVGIIQPTIRTIVAIRRATIAEYETLERRYRQGRNINLVLKEFTAARPQLTELEQMIPNERTVLTFIQHIERAAAAHGVQETAMLDRDALKAIGGDLQRMPIIIDLLGPYPNVIAALRDIERLPLILPITDVAFTVESGNLDAPGAHPRVRLHISGATPWRTAKETPTGT